MKSRYRRNGGRGHLSALALCLAVLSPAPSFAQDVLAFDFGPVSSNRLGVQTVDLTGFKRGDVRWIIPPTIQHLNRTHAKSRDEVTVDGVGGPQLALRLPATSGFAHVAFMAEAGTQDASGLRFSIDGKAQDLGWLAFEPPSEPRTAPRPEVRLFSGTVKTSGDHSDLNWSNSSEPVLLGWLQVIPLSDAKISDPRLLQLMERAGNTETMEPLASLRDGLRGDARSLAGEFAVVDFWLDTMIKADRYFEEYRGWTWADARSGLSMFGRYSQAIMWLDGLIADPMFRDTPLYARALFQRARLQYWMWMEGHGGEMSAAAIRDWKTLSAMKVRPDLTPMYLGETVPHASPCDNLSVPRTTPLWAARQRDALCRLEELLGWWVNVRQAENGELGGKWGDDVEMLRWWQIPLLAGSAEASKGWARLADGVWASDLVADGYHRRISDVEHAAEPIADTLLIYALSSDPERVARLEPSARQFVRDWTHPVAKDERRFRSAWFGTEGVDTRPPRDRDVGMNARAAKAVRFHVNASDDPVAKSALIDWSRMWARATLSTEKGKPAGVVPPSIRFSDGAINGDEPSWYKANMFWDYFDWSGDAKIYDQILFAFNISGDAALNEPLLRAFDLVAQHRNQPAGDAAVGSTLWAARELLGSDTFHAVWGQWRLLTGDDRYDALLKEVSPSRYLRFRLTGDDKVLAGASQGIINRLSVNWPLVTSEALFTDRVYATARGDQVDYADMIAMMTGAMSTDSPYYHVTWHDRKGDLAYLVRDADADSMRLEIVSFGKDASATAKFWQLNQGSYCLTVGTPSGRLNRDKIAIGRHGQEHAFRLPNEGLYRIAVSPAQGNSCSRR